MGDGLQNNFSEKELAIFEAVSRLLAQGVNLNQVKVADIAAAAGIGKGTVYEYFTSKEEIIFRSILYHLNIEVGSAFNLVGKEGTFQDKIYALLDIIEANLKNHFSIFELFMASSVSVLLGAKNQDNTAIGAEYFAAIKEITKELLEAARQERLVAADVSIYYLEMVVHSAFSGWICYLKNEQRYDKITPTEAKACAYRLIIKGLA